MFGIEESIPLLLEMVIGMERIFTCNPHLMSNVTTYPNEVAELCLPRQQLTAFVGTTSLVRNVMLDLWKELTDRSVWLQKKIRRNAVNSSTRMLMNAAGLHTLPKGGEVDNRKGH